MPKELRISSTKRQFICDNCKKSLVDNKYSNHDDLRICRECYPQFKKDLQSTEKRNDKPSVTESGTTSVGQPIKRREGSQLRITDTKRNYALIEIISDKVHWIWAHWMKYFLPKDLKKEFTPADKVRWSNQMITSYYDLTEKEKKSDRELANQIIQDFLYDPYTGEKL